MRLGRAKSSRTTRSVHLSPINCSAPAIGQPSILRRRTRRITRFRAEAYHNYCPCLRWITCTRQCLNSVFSASSANSSLCSSAVKFKTKAETAEEPEVLAEERRDLKARAYSKRQILEISSTLHHNALAVHASIRLTNCNFPPSIREHDRQNHFTLSGRRKAR